VRRSDSVCHRNGRCILALSMFLYLCFLPFGVYIRSVSWGRRDHRVRSMEYVFIPVLFCAYWFYIAYTP